jgi:hypothetical protein
MVMADALRISTVTRKLLDKANFKIACPEEPEAPKMTNFMMH